jgi:hypothetical protein
MTTNKYTELNRSVETSRKPAPIDDVRNLDRRASEWASTASFNDTRYIDTPPALHMTATWGN